MLIVRIFTSFSAIAILLGSLTETGWIALICAAFLIMSAASEILAQSAWMRGNSVVSRRLNDVAITFFMLGYLAAIFSTYFDASLVGLIFALFVPAMIGVNWLVHRRITRHLNGGIV